MEAASFVTMMLTVWRTKLRRSDLAACHDSRSLLAYTILPPSPAAHGSPGLVRTDYHSLP